MMRRYIGRASGKHRSTRQRRFRIFILSGLAVGVLGLVLIGVLIMNPGDDRPANPEGSMSPASVTPTLGTPTPTPGHTRHCHRHCW